MSEWWTYRPRSFLLFSASTYDALVAQYNAALWPLQWAILALAATALVVAWRGGAPALQRGVWVLLGGAWLWIGWGFHHRQFAAINWAADHVAVAFAAQGAALLWLGLRSDRLACDSEGRRSPRRLFGAAIVILALAGLPLLAAALGRPWARTEWLGLMSEPTALATLGFFLLMARRPPLLLAVLPLAAMLLSGALASGLRQPWPWLGTAVAAAAAAALVGRTLGRRPAR